MTMNTTDPTAETLDGPAILASYVPLRAGAVPADFDVLYDDPDPDPVLTVQEQLDALRDAEFPEALIETTIGRGGTLLSVSVPLAPAFFA